MNGYQQVFVGIVLIVFSLVFPAIIDVDKPKNDGALLAVIICCSLLVFPAGAVIIFLGLGKL